MGFPVDIIEIDIKTVKKSDSTQRRHITLYMVWHVRMVYGVRLATSLIISTFVADGTAKTNKAQRGVNEHRRRAVANEILKVIRLAISYNGGRYAGVREHHRSSHVGRNRSGK